MMSTRLRFIIGVFAVFSLSVHATDDRKAITLEMPSIKRIEALAQSIDGCISLAQGALRIGGIDQHTKEYAREVLLSDKADYYGDALGLPALRQQLAKTLSNRYAITIGTEHIFIGHGGIGVLSTLALALLKQGDEIILPEPAYPAYKNIAKLAKATPIFTPAYHLQQHATTGASAWHFDLSRIENAITDKTKMILLSHPSNPSGVCLTRDELAKLSSLCKEKKIYLIIDEVYDDFIYEGDFASGTEFALQSPFTIRVGSFSKNYGMSGWRVGFAVAHPELVAATAPVQAATISNATCIAQYAALYALQHPEHIAHYAATLKKNRDMMCAFFDALQERGIIQYERPRAGFYLFFRTDQPNSFDVVMDVLQQANVAMTPGTDFGPSATPFIRVCFARNPEVLEESITRLSKYFAKKYPEKFY